MIKLSRALLKIFAIAALMALLIMLAITLAGSTIPGALEMNIETTHTKTQMVV